MIQRTCMAVGFVLLLAAGPATQPSVIPARQWGSKPQPIAEERRQTPRYITLHHAGVIWKAGDDPEKKLVNLQAWGQKEKKWPDLPYHYLIAPDGRIFEGRPVQFEPETNTTYKTAGHIGIQLWGDFEKQRPSRRQIEAAVLLTAHLSKEHKIDLKDIGGHKDRAETDCPGKDFYRYLESGQFRRWVSAAVEGKPLDIDPGPPLKDGPLEIIPGSDPPAEKK